jgi:hypothetical protein
MAQLRIKKAAEARGKNLNQLYQALNTARAQRGDRFVAMGTVRRYWYSTETGATGADELDQVSWSFLQEVAGVLGVSVYDLLPSEDGLGNKLPTPRMVMQDAA